jgi:hypothetical protein
MYGYCLGSMRTAWCRRFAHYRASRTSAPAPGGLVVYVVVATSTPQDAMFCKQHAQEYAEWHNRLLQDAQADKLYPE